jgi:hypothetical protein
LLVYNWVASLFIGKELTMLQRVVIKSKADQSLKPLVEVAIRNQLKALQHGITRTKERLLELEKKAGMSSDEFERHLNANEIEETLETVDWNMEIQALRLLEEQYHSLSEAKID